MYSITTTVQTPEYETYFMVVKRRAFNCGVCIVQDMSLMLTVRCASAMCSTATTVQPPEFAAYFTGAKRQSLRVWRVYCAIHVPYVDS